MCDQYDKLSLKELKQHCRDNNLKGYSKHTNKNGLKGFIRGLDGELDGGLDKDTVIKDLQDKIKEYELKECFEDTESDNEFTFDRKYDDSITDNIIMENREREHQKVMDTLQNKYDTLHHQHVKLKLNKDMKKGIEDKIQKKIKETFTPVMLDLEKNYKATTVTTLNNKYQIERYNLFIDRHNGLDKQLILFHGTNIKNINPIMENGFSLTTDRAHGSLYGEGIYFTPNIDLALMYPKDGNPIRHILISQVYVNNIIEGRKAVTTFPKLPGTSNYYDTGVDNIYNPTQYVKKSVEDINIIAHIRIDIRKLKKPLTKSTWTNKTGIKIINNTDKNLHIYWNPLKGKSLVDIDINICKKMNEILQGTRSGITTYIGEQFIAGYYDKDKSFNIIKLIEVCKLKEQFIIE